MALDWKDGYDTDIEILNIFSWDYNDDEVFDLVYDDRQQFTLEDDDMHYKQMSKVLEDAQWYAGYASKSSNRNHDGYPMVSADTHEPTHEPKAVRASKLFMNTMAKVVYEQCVYEHS